ncbi:phosphotransferase [Kroppenstedtia pulmonis]|uniref:Phosphotransferase n=1 Tax=Kroppenstedtia pulmonis TaxID=1380685 RepID=A0A7D3XI64_9BACL|nr:phosphotransferase [Kroppenstedtia pulmonis]QKG84264.1 phosphotransferase [Kroppenstedtia pulmonis]
MDVRLDPRDVKKAIEFYYPLQVLQVKKIRAAYRVETCSGVFAFKNALKLKDLSSLKLAVLELHRQGFNRVPRLCPSHHTGWLIPYHRETYYMEEWLESVTEVSPKKMDWLEPAGQALAQFHQVLSSLSPKSFAGSRNAIGRWEMELPWHRQQVKRWIGYHQGHYKLLQVLHFIHDRLERAILEEKKARQLERSGSGRRSISFCHGSLHHENIMMDSWSQVWLIDYERMVWDRRVRDLAQLMQYHFEKHDWPIKDVSRFIQAYHKVSPLHEHEWHDLKARMLLPSRLLSSMYQVFEHKAWNEKRWKRLVTAVNQEQRKKSVLEEGLFPSLG